MADAEQPTDAALVAPDEQAMRDYAAWLARRGAPEWVMEIALDELTKRPESIHWYEGYMVGRAGKADLAQQVWGALSAVFECYRDDGAEYVLTETEVAGLLALLRAHGAGPTAGQEAE